MDNSEEDDLLSAAMSDAGLDVILNDSTQSYAASQTDFELCSTKNTVSQALNIPENSTVHPPGIGTSQQQVPVVPTSVQLKCGSGKSVRIVVRKSAANKPTVLLQGKQLAMISKIPPNRLVLHKNSSGPRFAAPTTLNTSTNGVNAKNTQLTSTVFKPVVNTSRNALPAQQYAQSDFVRPTQLEKFRNPNLRMPVIMRQPRMSSYQQPLQRSKNATWTSSTSNANAANLGSGNRFSSTVSENPYYNADETMQAEIEEAEGDFEMCHANTYADYVPSKLRSGLSHPDAVVETSSLASVQPPDIWYHVSIPEEIIDHGFISALQLETIIYACQQHETFLPSGERSGYLIGDGPGVGKGRTIAGIIYENYLLGRKRSLWFSVSSDLKYDAQRDLEDVGAQKIKVHALNKFKYTKVSGKENGSVKKGVIFATYASLIGESQNAKSKYRTRMKQLLHWCGSRFDGVIVLDECHRAKNLCPVGSSRPSKTGQTVMELQKALPKARIVYASATGATEPRHMAYMVRLGLWGNGRAFSDFNSFISAVERRGVGAMEIIAMDMKLRGLYLARQLSFSGVSFRVEEVPLSAEFIQMYDTAVKLWLETRKQFQMVTDMLNINSAGRKAMWGQFWASHQRFFKYLCIAAKVNACVRLARESVRNGKCVVIGLQSTGEARTLEQLGDCGGELTDFISTAKGVFQSLVEKHFPTSDRYGMSTSMLGIKRSSSTAFGRVDLSWKQNLRREKSKRPNSDLAALSEGSDEDQSLAGLDSDDERSDSDDSGSNSSSDANSASDEDDDDALSDNDNDNYDNDDDDEDDDDDDDDDLNDSLNPFFSDTEQDPWEMKLKRAGKKSKKKKRPLHSSNSEDGDTWPDEEPTDHRKVDKQDSLANHVAMSAAEFLGSGNSFLCSEYDGDNLNDTDLGITKANLMKADLLVAIERLGETLPPNTLDQLIDELGGPDYVAEMTGRKGRVVSNDEGQVQYELRHDADVPLEMLNLKEKERFMTGEKRIAIISEAASSGISLHSDRRAPNQRRRVHITLELPWSADKAIQQFGRTHRSNQINSPEYVFLISELAGEQRFASVVAKRLESLGALTHGDRRATETRDLSQFNLDTKYGRTALEVTLKSIVGWQKPLVEPPKEYAGNFFQDMRQYLEGIGLAYCEKPGGPVILDKEMNLTKFLNRILGLPVSAQNYLFQFFSDTLKEVVDQAKRDGRYDLGILDLGQKQERVRKMETKIFRNHWLPGDLKTELHKVCVERGLPWSEAMDLHCMNMGEEDGFYISTNPRLKPSVIFICAVRKKRYDYYDDSQMYSIFKPYSCLNSKQENLSIIKQKYRKVSPTEAEKIWQEIYESSGTQCQHIYWYGKCRNVMAGSSCEVGKRTRFLHILSGSVFAVWNLVESVLNTVQHRQQNRMQIVRLRTEANQKLVGLLIPNACVELLIQRLQSDQAIRMLST